MNLAESMKYVLRTKSQNIFTHLWKEDLKSLLQDILEDIWSLQRASTGVLQELKHEGVKKTLKEFYSSTTETLKIFKIVPHRVQAGFSYFKEDFLKELDLLVDSKQKTIFCLKVISALSSFILRFFYGMKKSKTDFSIAGLKPRNAFTRLLIAEVVFKVSQVLVVRILNEVEKELTDPEDIKNVRFFKGILNDSKQYSTEKDIFLGKLEPGDRALELVENLKKYISTGIRA